MPTSFSSLRPFACAAVLTAAALAGGGCQRTLTAIRESGDKALVQGDYDKAVAEYQEYLDQRPWEPKVRASLGTAYLGQGQTAHAREQLLVAHSQAPESDEILDQLCEALLANESYTDLTRILRQRTIDRGKMTDFLRLGTYAQKMGDADEAKRALVTAARVDAGQTAEPFLALSDFYASVNDHDKAVQYLRMAYAIDPKDGRIGPRAQALNQIVGPSFATAPQIVD